MGTRWFITVFKRACHWILFWDRWMQPKPSHTIPSRTVLVSSAHQCTSLLSDLFLTDFPSKILYAYIISSVHATCPTQPILLYLITLIFGEKCKLWTSHHVIFYILLLMPGGMVAQAVLCLTTVWTIGVQSLTGAEDFSSSPCVQTGCGAHPASYSMGTGGKAWPGRDADHSPPSSAKDKNE
jgi:hypothetical protein